MNRFSWGGKDQSSWIVIDLYELLVVIGLVVNEGPYVKIIEVI